MTHVLGYTAWPLVSCNYSQHALLTACGPLTNPYGKECRSISHVQRDVDPWSATAGARVRHVKTRISNFLMLYQDESKSFLKKKFILYTRVGIYFKFQDLQKLISIPTKTFDKSM